MKQLRPRTRLQKTVAASAVALALGSAYALGTFHVFGHPVDRVEAAPQVIATPGVATPSVALPDMSEIVARNGAAVVNISVAGTRKMAATPDDFPGLDPDDPFYEFFRHFRVPPQGKETVHGLGSGFIVSADGTILTNAHVVDGADEVTVKLTDKREFNAKVKGLDKASDVAVLKIDAHDLPTLKIGDINKVRVGQWVLAIGSPFGFENSASAGIVSAKGRSLPDGSYVPFIQTDVAVNPGNSGGPLFNMAGEVIGINSQIYSRSGGYQGLSFAIPIDVAMNVEHQIVSGGKVQRGRLGVTIQEVNQSLADSFGLPRPAGALVNEVEKGSPAAKAGLQPGDVILGINSRDIASSGELPAIVAGMRPGDVARLKIWRHGSASELDIKVGAFNDQAKVADSKPAVDRGRLGVGVRPLSQEEQRRSEVNGGLLVEQVGGAAARAGVQQGDILLSVNGEAVTSVEQLRALVAKAGKRIAVLVQRSDSRIFIPVDLG